MGKLQNLSHLNCGLQICQIWIQLITVCEKCCKVYKHASLMWSYWRRHWRMAATMTTWSSLVNSVLSRCFSSSWSVMRIFLHLFLRYFLHSVINWIQFWRIWSPQLRWDKFWVSFCINSMIARAQWAFQVLQGSVETLFRWGGKRVLSFYSKFIQETV